MLDVTKEKDRRIERVERMDNSLFLYSEAGIHRLEPKNDRTVRISFTVEENFRQEKKPGVICREVYGNWNMEEDSSHVSLLLEHVRIVVDKMTGSYCYYDGDGKLMLKERDRDSKVLEAFTTYRLEENSIRTEKVETPDGVKEVVREAAKVPDGKSYHTRLYLEWGDNEALYGLGQHEEGYGSLRGQTVYVHQANRKIAIPMLVSTLGYGILTDTYSPMIFSDTIEGSYLYTEADPEMDYYFMNGGSMDGVVGEYRFLTGKASLLPRWAFGYIQSQERYETQKEILEVAEKYRKKGIGLDGIVLDWCSWEGDKWGQKTMDAVRFPNPGEMVEKLHDEHVHFMISVWPNMAENTENYREFQEHKLLLPGTTIYNALLEEGRAIYWKQLREGLLIHGIDAWWCDNSEPITPEWNHVERVEPAVMYVEYCRMAGEHLPAESTNAFALYHAQSIYEGQRTSNEKRVVNLTRSAYTGQQRYGAILWSGDIEATWETLRKQVAAGLHFCASGLPFWTMDIGAFFVKRGNLWYWKGDYPDTYEDLGYRELFVRWYQWGAFLPVFRGHGTDCRRELWQFENDGLLFYDALLSVNRLRYELLPYIYSYAGLCWLENQSMMRLLAFVWPEDVIVRNITDQYLFGNEIMVCPVLQPMYYESGSRSLHGTKLSRRIYLPAGNGWYDYWTDTYYEGGQWLDTDVPIDRIPLFIREGSIIPKVGYAQSTEETGTKLEITVYSGKDTAFTLYEDAGDGYDYEQGKYSVRRLVWTQEKGQLTVKREEENVRTAYEKYEIGEVRIICP